MGWGLGEAESGEGRGRGPGENRRPDLMGPQPGQPGLSGEGLCMDSTQSRGLGATGQSQPGANPSGGAQEET